jgi:hypothetical protein
MWLVIAVDLFINKINGNRVSILSFIFVEFAFPVKAVDIDGFPVDFNAEVFPNSGVFPQNGSQKMLADMSDRTSCS